MWFWLSLAALVCWSGSDIFSKLGCREPSDRHAYLKMLTAVGTVMGLHAAAGILSGRVPFSLQVVWAYLPVSALYILSMALGYVGLRYIELSISSPVCNSSGALVAVLCLLTGGPGAVNGWQLFAVALVCAGVIGLGIVESTEDDSLRSARQKASNYRYAKSWLALALPLAYCLLDAAGTFADSLVLRKLEESAANTAYELTFFCVGLISFIYVVLIRRERLVPRLEAPKYLGAICETAGQAAYIYAIGDEDHVLLAAPIISAYCVASVLWSRIFLKEKLSVKHYAAIALVVAGIVILGIFDA